MTRNPLVLALGIAALTALPAGAQTKYVAFGDSVTNPGGDFDDPSLPCPEECGYPARLEDLLQAAGIQAEVVNAGLGGEDTSQALSRLPDVLAQEGGDVLLLMEGTNDISRGYSPETVQFNLDRLAEIAEGRGLEVVHATVIPRVPDAIRGDGDNVLTQQLAWEIREMAFQEGRDLADPFEVFGSQPNLFADFYAPGEDAVGHPNAAGFDLLAEIFFDVLTGVDSVPPVLGGFEPPDGATNVSPSAQVRLRLYDFGAGIDLAATDLLIDGSAVPASREGNARRLDLRYQPTTGFSGVVEIGYDARDIAPSPNQRRRIVGTFTTRGTQFVPGDVNRDGRVDGIDLVQLARHFGTSNGDAGYARFVDINQDNRIDGTDLAILASNFGEAAS